MTALFKPKIPPSEKIKWFIRFGNFLKGMIEAMEFGPYKYFEDRLTRLENEMRELHKEKNHQ